jgi:hypothetical protein
MKNVLEMRLVMMNTVQSDFKSVKKIEQLNQRNQPD